MIGPSPAGVATVPRPHRDRDHLLRQQDIGERDGIALISVIIPCYNQALFLGEAIESVLAQSYPRVEIIVVDDGSSDDTAVVAARYPGVCCIRQENQGLAAARNVGLQQSKGDYLVFLDADDRLCPQALAVGADCLRARTECAFVYGRYRAIASDGAVLSESPLPSVGEKQYLALLRGNHIAMHGTVIYRRTALVSVAGFNPALKACEDYDLYLRIARTSPIAAHEAIVAEYRQHDANMSRDATLMLDTALAALRAQRPHLRKCAERRVAYQTGVRYWRRHYGRELSTVGYSALGAHDWRRARRPLLTLVRHYPPGLVTLLAGLVAARTRQTVRTVWGRPWPPLGRVRLGQLRRLTPLDPDFGYGRGQPIDRWYVERFLYRWGADVRGRVLEVGDDAYTRAIGGDRVAMRDVLHVPPGHSGATIVADLADADHIPSDTFDCIILTQTLHLIYDVRAAIATLHRILKPGGILLVTVPGISQISRDEWGESWYWSFTTRSVRRLFAERFLVGAIDVEAHGNVLTAIAFLHGLSATELTPQELDYHDPHYQAVITLRAVKTMVAT